MSKKLEKIIEMDNKYLFQNYGNRLPACFVKGDGSYLYDQDGKKYVDLFSGIAVSSLGYNNKKLTSALHKQIDNIIHSSNWFFNKEQTEAARLISELTFPGKTLFVNSGTEANEAAIKLARKYGQTISEKKYQIISFKGSFHGRTFGSLSATAQEKIRKGFGPVLGGFKFCELNDIQSFKNEIKRCENICAIIIEMIQGEGGINIADKSFIKELFAECKKNRVLTIVDEVQTGAGRTGKPFAYQHYNVKPDIITIAKGIGGGVPVGIIHAGNNIAKLFTGGTHGTTFGGNHLVCTAVSSVCNELAGGKLLENVNATGKYIIDELKRIKKSVSYIKEVRGMGLHIGIELNRGGMDIVKKALSRGVVINCTVDKVLRIMPPLNIPVKTVKEGMAILEKILQEEE